MYEQYSCELRIGDSKTKHARSINFAAVSEVSAMDNAKAIRDHWRDSNFPMCEPTIESGFKVERPDYEVVRISLLGMTSEQVTRLKKTLSTSACVEARELSESSIQYIEERILAAATGSEVRKYVNVTGGRANCWSNRLMMRELAEIGLESFATPIPGPLMRAFTRKGRKVLSHMPHTANSTYQGPYAMKLVLEQAHAIVQAREGGDPEFDAGTRIAFGNHSLRRFADTIARQSMALLSITEEEINVYFGWKESELLKDMQRHYANMNLRERVKMARITSQI
jgi:hypothetical protein